MNLSKIENENKWNHFKNNLIHKCLSKELVSWTTNQKVFDFKNEAFNNDNENIDILLLKENNI